MSSTIISWNVNGFRAAAGRRAFEWVSKVRPDVVCLQETRLNAGAEPLCPEPLSGYHSYFSSGERKGYSGVATYTKQEPVSVETTFGAPAFDDEGRHQVIDFGSFLLANVYFPNGRMSAERLAYKLAYYEAFLDFANRVTANGRRLVICGDVNTAHKEIDIARPKANEKTSGFLPEERAWIDRLIEHGFVDTFRMFDQSPERYTWWSARARARERNVGWRLDYFFVDEGLAGSVKKSWILDDVMGSDHCPVGLELDL